MKNSTIKLFIVILTFAFFAGSCKNKEEIKESETDESETNESEKLEVKPAEYYLDSIKQLEAGDTLIISPAIYEGSVKFELDGEPDKPIVIRGEKGKERPVLKDMTKGSNLWEFKGNHIEIKHIEFQSLSYAIRIGKSEDILIEDCILRNNGGGCISANYPDSWYKDIRIKDNFFIGAKTTPVYIGNHNGSTPVERFVFEGNYVDGSDIHRENSIGYGIETKLNVYDCVIKNNFITGTQGPGIMVYGIDENNSEGAAVVKGNVVTGSRNNPGIVVGAGPAVVKNNLVFVCQSGGISVNDYGGRKLLDYVTVKQNTAFMNRPYDYGFFDLEPGSHITVTDNLSYEYDAYEYQDVISFRNLPKPEEGDDIEIIVENNRIKKVTSGIESAVKEIEKDQPVSELSSILEQHLSDGPLTAEEVTDLLKILSEKQ